MNPDTPPAAASSECHSEPILLTPYAPSTTRALAPAHVVADINTQPDVRAHHSRSAFAHALRGCSGPDTRLSFSPMLAKATKSVRARRYRQSKTGTASTTYKVGMRIRIGSQLFAIAKNGPATM